MSIADEWHVVLSCRPDLPVNEVDALRAAVNADLESWVKACEVELQNQQASVGLHVER